MHFEQILPAIKRGFKATRTGWNGKGLWVAAQYPDEGSKMGRPYIYMSTADGTCVPWAASAGDLFADDWMVVHD